MKPKVISTIIEDEVVFMTNPKVEFVSLVKYAATRMPFKILKHAKGGNPMKGTVQAILVKKGLSEKRLEELRKEFTLTTKSESDDEAQYDVYIQQPKKDFKEESLTVLKPKDEDDVFYIVGTLKKDEKDPVIKDGIEATLSDLYTALYAMADVVSGVLRQENGTASFKRKTVLQSIDNFRSFAEVVLETIKDNQFTKAEDHPALVKSFYIEKDGKKVPPNTDKPDKDLATFKTGVNEKLTAFEASMKKVSDAVESFKTLSDTFKEEIETLKAMPAGTKSDPPDPKNIQKEESIYSGLLFKTSKE